MTQNKKSINEKIVHLTSLFNAQVAVLVEKPVDEASYEEFCGLAKEGKAISALLEKDLGVDRNTFQNELGVMGGIVEAANARGVNVEKLASYVTHFRRVFDLAQKQGITSDEREILTVARSYFLAKVK